MNSRPTVTHNSLSYENINLQDKKKEYKINLTRKLCYRKDDRALRAI